VTVAVDSQGDSIHLSAPQFWQQKIGMISVLEK
jgi:hypothetical protein